jgi:four helix bundle protein
MQDYRRLRVHSNAHALVLNVRRVANKFPRTGYVSLKSQMTRAAESIPFNIVEGCGANSQSEFARFLDIAIRSTTELEYQLELARDYEVLPPRDWHSLSVETSDVRRMLWGLRNKVLATIPSPARLHGQTENGQTGNP